MLEFTRLKNNLKKSADGLSTIRLAMLCNYSSQHLHLAIKGYGIDRKLNFEIFEAEYDQIEQQVFDENAELYHFAPEIIVISKSSYKLLDEFYATPLPQRKNFAEQSLLQLQALASTLQERSSATIIFFNFQELNDGVFGNYAANVPVSFLFQVRTLNLLLMQEAQQRKGLLIADVQALTTEAGIKNIVDQKNLVKADMIWSLEFLPTVAKTVVGLIEAIKGSFRKCLVLDLDNTIWGGVIGDDGLEGIELGDLGIGKAYSRFQKWIKELKQRGIIICVCSKNEEPIAREVFEKHPDMTLTTDDIAVFAVNWNNKVDNIHFIKNTLNISFDAMVFVDDNPFERGMVKEAIPELEVPEMPEDPVDYLPYLQSLNLFETVSYTAEDEHRTMLYRQEAERVAYQQVYKNEDEYLQQLHMNAEIRSLDAFTIPRAAQLSQRSNQFNLRTVRYSEADLNNIASAQDYFPFVVSLKDKFGDYGIISFIVLKKDGSNNLFIENWMMSCRVLKRGVEHAVLKHIVFLAREVNCQTIIGEYMPTAKNALVKDHYKNLGFREKHGLWVLNVESFEDRKTFIHQPSAIQKREVISE